MKFINKIDQFRKLGDFIAMIIFFCLSYYLYKNNYYKLSLFIFICGLVDLIFTIDAIKLHGDNLFNLTF